MLCPSLLLLLLNCFSHVWLCTIPQTAAHQAPLSLGFSRQEHWNGLPFPSPVHEGKRESEVPQSCPTQRPHGLQHARLPCPSPALGAYSNSCPSHQWCHPAISSSVVPFSSLCLQSFPASRSFPRSQFSSGGQTIGVSASASVLPVNIQYWFPFGWTGWISWQSKELSRVFNTTIQKHQFFVV